MRGSLINPGLVEIARIDPAATRALNPPGPATSGFDEDFKEPEIAAPEEGEQLGELQTQLQEPIMLPAQQEVDTFEDQSQVLLGSAPSTVIVLVFHFRDLEEAGLVNADGTPKLNVGDRLLAMYTARGVLVQQFKDPPGVYARMVLPYGVGIGGERNLLRIRFEEAERGPKS